MVYCAAYIVPTYAYNYHVTTIKAGLFIVDRICFRNAQYYFTRFEFHNDRH